MLCWKTKRNRIAHDIFDAIIEQKAKHLKITKKRVHELIVANGQNFSELDFLSRYNHDLNNQHTLLFITRSTHYDKR